jgi:hypothetical protein
MALGSVDFAYTQQNGSIFILRAAFGIQMTQKGWRTEIALPVVVLMMAVVSSSLASADVAPLRVQGGGATGVLCNQTEMRMYSFSVDVTVDLPNVHEIFTYLLDNPTDHGISQSIVIPITFDAYYSRLYTLDSAKMTVNGAAIGYSQGNITLEPALVIDSPKIIGLMANIYFPQQSTTNLTLDMERTFDSYTSSFVYIYSARTARYWNGTIAHGHFRLAYLSELDEMTCMMPNALKDDRAVTSDMYDWDGNSIYNVTVKTGVVRHRHYPPSPVEHSSIPPVLMVGIGIVVVVAAVIAAYWRKKRR